MFSSGEYLPGEYVYAGLFGMPRYVPPYYVPADNFQNSIPANSIFYWLIKDIWKHCAVPQMSSDRFKFAPIFGAISLICCGTSREGKVTEGF